MSVQRLQETLPKHLAQWATELHAVGLLTGLCPWLLAALVDRESRGGLALSPPGPGGTGDKGHGRGLAQIDDRFHAGFVSATDSVGKRLWQVPAYNLLYGARLLRSNLDVLGDVSLALAAYNAGVARVRKAIGPGLDGAILRQRDAADRVTTGGNYGADVLRRRAQWAPAEAPPLFEARN